MGPRFSGEVSCWGIAGVVVVVVMLEVVVLWVARAWGGCMPYWGAPVGSLKMKGKQKRAKSMGDKSNFNGSMQGK